MKKLLLIALLLLNVTTAKAGTLKIQAGESFSTSNVSETSVNANYNKTLTASTNVPYFGIGFTQDINSRLYIETEARLLNTNGTSSPTLEMNLGVNLTDKLSLKGGLNVSYPLVTSTVVTDLDRSSGVGTQFGAEYKLSQNISFELELQTTNSSGRGSIRNLDGTISHDAVDYKFQQKTGLASVSFNF